MSIDTFNPQDTFYTRQMIKKRFFLKLSQEHSLFSRRSILYLLLPTSFISKTFIRYFSDKRSGGRSSKVSNTHKTNYGK